MGQCALVEADGRLVEIEAEASSEPPQERPNRIEIMFGRLKGWRRGATRYDRCPMVFLLAIARAARVIYRQGVPTLVSGLKIR